MISSYYFRSINGLRPPALTMLRNTNTNTRLLWHSSIIRSLTITEIYKNTGSHHGKKYPSSSFSRKSKVTTNDDDYAIPLKFVPNDDNIELSQAEIDLFTLFLNVARGTNITVRVAGEQQCNI